MLVYAERAAVRRCRATTCRQRVALDRPLRSVPGARLARFVLLGSEKLTRKHGHQAYSDRTLTLREAAARHIKLSSKPAICASPFVSIAATLARPTQPVNSQKSEQLALALDRVTAELVAQTGNNLG